MVKLSIFILYCLQALIFWFSKIIAKRTDAAHRWLQLRNLDLSLTNNSVANILILNPKYWSNSFSIMWIIIEVEDYESNSWFQSLSERSYAEDYAQKNTFWDNATKYAASANKDESFVSEIAYMMVTLHRTGA